MSERPLDPRLLRILRKEQMQRGAEASVALDPENHTGVHTCDGRCALDRGTKHRQSKGPRSG